MDRNTNLRDLTVKSTSGKDVKDTSQLKGEAKDSLSGTNVTKQFETSVSIGGPNGGMNKNR